jgi:hypothetical protein
MISVEARKGAEINPFQYIARKLAITVLSPVARSERTDEKCSINKAKEMSKNGKGLIIVINHPTGKDPEQALYEIFRHSILDTKKVITPIAYHIDNFLYPILKPLIGLTRKPIVTESTIKKGKNKGHKLNEGMTEYFDEAIEGLKKGEIVVVAPQGERMSHLGEPDKPTIGRFMAGAKRKDLNDYAFLFIGFGIEGVSDYSNKKLTGLNLFKRYTTNIGSCLTSEEILVRAAFLAKEAKKISGKTESVYKFVDQVIFEELRNVVPANYL